MSDFLVKFFPCCFLGCIEQRKLGRHPWIYAPLAENLLYKGITTIQGLDDSVGQVTSLNPFLAITFFAPFQVIFRIRLKLIKLRHPPTYVPQSEGSTGQRLINISSVYQYILFFISHWCPSYHYQLQVRSKITNFAQKKFLDNYFIHLTQVLQ